jgi:hypothetical protein
MEPKNRRAPIAQLRELLEPLPPGPIAWDSEMLSALAACWDDLDGSDSAAMAAHKLYRAEFFQWQPPYLTFCIERHGGTVMGSTRGERQGWNVDVKQGRADFYSVGHVQLSPTDQPFRAGPVVAEIVNRIVAGVADNRLKWESPDNTIVRVLTSQFITGRVPQTEQGRRRRFRAALEKALSSVGWASVPRKRDVYAMKAPG